MNRRFRKEIKSVCGWNVSKIYYTIDEATGNILIDLYEIEKEAISVMQKEFPRKKVYSSYIT